MRNPTPVTPRSITAVSGSINPPHGTLKFIKCPAFVCIAPAGTQSNRVKLTTRSPTGRAINWKIAPKAKHIERNTLPTHTTFTALFGKRRPKNSIRAAPARGNSGIIQMCARKYSVGIMSVKSYEPIACDSHSERSEESLRACVRNRGIPRFARNDIAFFQHSHQERLGLPLPLQQIHFIAQQCFTIPDKRTDN